MRNSAALLAITIILIASSTRAEDKVQYDKIPINAPEAGFENKAPDPFANIMNSFFNSGPFAGSPFANDKKFLPLRIQASNPKMDVYETKENMIIQFEIPGIDKDKLNLEITDNYVSLKYEEKQAKDTKDKNYSVNERSYGSFARVVSIPSYVDSKQADAKYDNGVLTITMPKTEEKKTKPRKIEIK